MNRFWFPIEEDNAVYKFFLQDGREITGQVKVIDWLYTGEVCVLGVLEGASPTDITYIPWHAVMTFKRLVTDG